VSGAAKKRFIEAHGKLIEVESLPPPKSLRGKRAPGFVQIPVERAGKWSTIIHEPSLMVIVMLWYLAWKTKSCTFPLSNEVLAPYGVSRWTKCRVLAQLEKAGEITVVRRGKHAPIVTLL
jgi:hypothetical protein